MTAGMCKARADAENMSSDDDAVTVGISHDEDEGGMSGAYMGAGR